MYYQGDGVEEDEKKGIQLYRGAAKQGHQRAKFNLGNYYLKEEDISQAKKIYEELANENNGMAQYNLGYIYLIHFNRFLS
ncbi:tetratricopeptide repeat protein [Acinetobacter sp. YH12096]|uniref:tetratricopeptide repeat protein n=1 Tax=Acinetobacter sp. YH12096 TaxID=2601085 RepID=UPI0015D25CEE|nr:SEL1-like repeat protein [Acinetobacter sp. YH12096]